MPDREAEIRELWVGDRWIPASTDMPASEDGKWAWTGQQWLPVRDTSQPRPRQIRNTFLAAVVVAAGVLTLIAIFGLVAALRS